MSKIFPLKCWRRGRGGNLKKILPTNNDMDFLTFHIFTTMDLFCLIFFHLDFYLDFFIFKHGYILKNFFLLMDFCSLDLLDIQTLNRGGAHIKWNGPLLINTQRIQVPD
jgi:hypothetical protein